MTSSKFIYVGAYARISFFFKVNNSPLYVQIASTLSIHRSMNTWVSSISWLLWIRLPWTLACKSIQVQLSILLDINPEAVLLNPMVTLFSICSGTIAIFYSEKIRQVTEPQRYRLEESPVPPRAQPSFHHTHQLPLPQVQAKFTLN